MPTDFDPEYAEASVLTVKGHTLNNARQWLPVIFLAR